MTFDINNFEDEEVWDLICEGRTKGVFQLESSLGKHWAKEVQPRNISELAATISLIRPGTLKAKDEKTKKSMTQIYAYRKAGNPDYPVEYLHESLEPILKETYGVLVYQEQSMMIAQRLAGFNLKEADDLRKAIGKKKADLMEEIKQKFVDGAKKQGIVSQKAAEEIFSWIEKSSRYAFNKSHAVAYAINAYWSAYCKTHRILRFYQSSLNRSDRKPKSEIEIKQLVMDAKSVGIETYPPRLNRLYTNFQIDEPKRQIYFGLRHIKGVGQKECEKIEELGDVSEYNWLDCLINIIHKLKLNKRAVIALISVGAFNGKNNTETRQKMLYEFDSWKQLSAREQSSIVDNQKDPSLRVRTLPEAIKVMMSNTKINSRRIESVENIMQSLVKPFYNLDDHASSIADQETKFMGCALTCSKVDDTQIATDFCNDVANGIIKKKVNLAVVITSIRVIRTKKGKTPGQEMAFMCVEDSSGELDSITVFPETYEKNKSFLLEGNTVMLMCEPSKKDKGSVIVNKVIQI
jgi:DNA polymerase III alpha subunit